MKVYHYFIRYSCASNGELCAQGMTEMCLTSPITEFDDLLEIADKITDSYIQKGAPRNTDTIIDYYKLLRVEEE